MIVCCVWCPCTIFSCRYAASPSVRLAKIQACWGKYNISELILIISTYFSINHSLNPGHDQLSEIIPYLVTLNKTDVYKLGVKLGLQYSTLVGLPDENFINPMLTHWLQEADDVRSKGKTSWRSLVWGLREVQQNGIAKRIARDHRTTDLHQVQCTYSDWEVVSSVNITWRSIKSFMYMCICVYWNQQNTS